MSQTNGDNTMGAVIELLRHLSPRQLGWLRLYGIPAVQAEQRGIRPTGEPGTQVVRKP